MKKNGISSATKIKILDAARKVVLDNGAESLTLERVAQEAGLSKGGLLYHFPTKRNLIEGMIARLIARVDAALEEELLQSGGDYVTAYIRASFRTDPEEQGISNALIAATANDPDLIKPLQERFDRMQNKMAEAAISPEIGTIIRLALDGMWMSDLYGFAPPSPGLREKMSAVLLTMNQLKD
jgi:AcrR family transcriptional regulator